MSDAATASPATAAIEAHNCSRWYGHVLGVSDVNLAVRGGIVGLLGPNGAGKSTLMKMMVGLLAPSRGVLRVLGGEPWRDVTVRRRIGYCPEHDKLYDQLTALEFVAAMAELSGVARAQAGHAAERVLCQLGLKDALHRRIGGFSKGMRQRTKLAQCLVHDPDLLVLDEPLTGVDPVARAEITERIRELGAAGKTVVVSSHVLYEVEAITEEIVVMYRGQVLAEGNRFAIRTLIDKYPHRIRIDCERPRELAGLLAAEEHITRISFERGALVAETRDPDRCYELITRAGAETGIGVRALSSADNSLGAVFDYLTGGGR
jgi:ABC-2 type transport system ATP-binding protein